MEAVLWLIKRVYFILTHPALNVPCVIAMSFWSKVAEIHTINIRKFENLTIRTLCNLIKFFSVMNFICEQDLVDNLNKFFGRLSVQINGC